MVLTVDPRVASSIPTLPHTFTEIDHEIISTTIHISPADLIRFVVSKEQKYVHKVLVNRLVKLAQDKKCG